MKGFFINKGRNHSEIVAKYLFAPNIQPSGAIYKAQIFKGLNGTTEVVP